MQAGAAQSRANATHYAQNVTVMPPPGLAAGTWQLYVSLSPHGSSNSVNVTVPHTVTGITPTSGSDAGGLLVTITGTGFSDAAADVAVQLSGADCAVVSTNATAITCLTGRSLAKAQATPGGAGSSEVAVQPSAFAPLRTAAGLTFQYISAPVVTGVSPPRGSTAGGTDVVITGSRFPDSVQRIAMGDTECADVSWVSSSEIRCDLSDERYLHRFNHHRFKLAYMVSHHARRGALLMLAVFGLLGAASARSNAALTITARVRHA